LEGTVAGYQVVLVAASLVGVASFSYIALLLARLARLGATGWDYVLGFALLALSHAWAAVMALSSGRLAYTAYTATSSSALAGFLLLAQPRTRLASLVLVALPIVFDASASASALYAATRFRGPARLLVAVLSAGFALRAAGVAMLPSSTGALVLAAAELLRALAASLLALLYALTAAAGK